MIVIKIMYVSAAVMYLALGFLAAIISIKEFKKNNPTATPIKQTFAQKLSAWIRAFIFAFCPILNLICALVLALRWDDFLDACYEKVAEMCENY